MSRSRLDTARLARQAGTSSEAKGEGRSLLQDDVKRLGKFP